jgi:hypothetical protein
VNRIACNFADDRLPERFWSKCIPEPNSGCWLWIGATTDHGYASVRWRNRMRIAHRISYAIIVGPIDPDLVIDHLCRTRCCVNPAHMEPVTMAVNTARGFNSIAVAAATRARAASLTHCFRGHELTPSNVVRRPNGGRSCRRCTNIRKAAYRAASRGLLAVAP